MTKTGTIFVEDAQPAVQPLTEEQVDKHAEERSEAVSQLENLALDQQPVLFELSTVFPFELFPTTITIEKTKVNLRKTLFMGSADIRSILISDISSVESESNLFFGTLRIEKRMPPEPPMFVHYLKREEALKARRIIQGLMVTVSNKVDVTKVSSADLVDKVETLGDSKATS